MSLLITEGIISFVTKSVKEEAKEEEEEEEEEENDDKKKKKKAKPKPKRGASASVLEDKPYPLVPTCWAEVYCCKEKRWICVDPIRQFVDRPLDMGHAFEVPMIYVYGFEANGQVFDLSRRYTNKWTIQILELPDREWHEETIAKLSQRVEPDPDELVRLGGGNLNLLKAVLMFEDF